MTFETEPYPDLMMIKGVPYPAGIRFRQIIVTGPPGAGKSTLVRRLRGWPEEGFLDIALDRWWHNPLLTFRPREVHLGFPFQEHKTPLAVVDDAWCAHPTAVDVSRVKLPPIKRRFYHINWRERFLFDFLLLPPDDMYAWRKERALRGLHPKDRLLTPELVAHQVEAYSVVAAHFHRNGLLVCIREGFDGVPRRVVLDGDQPA